MEIVGIHAKIERFFEIKSKLVSWMYVNGLSVEDRVQGIDHYTEMTRHLFWLYDFDAGPGDDSLIAFVDNYDCSWLFGDYACVIYKALVVRRLDGGTSREL